MSEAQRAAGLSHGRSRNKALVKLRRSFGLNVRDFAKFIRMAEQTYCAYETGRLYPTPKDARALAELAGCEAGDLFPWETWRFAENMWEPRTLVWENGIPNDLLVSMEDPSVADLPDEHDTDALLRKSMLTLALREELSRLDGRAHHAIRARYGLDDLQEHTLGEVGAKIGIKSKNGAKYVLLRNLRMLRQRLSQIKELL